MRPLDPLRSIKSKLSVVILAAVAVTVAVVTLGVRAQAPPAVTAPAAALLALGMVWLLSRGMTSPLREMAAAAKAMARGDYSRRVSETSRDEVGELARAFNAMAAQLAETDRFRRDLVANVSHELRTPISALQAVLENLVDGVQPSDPETLRTMLAQTERLGRLVSQLLDLSRLEAGVVPLDRQIFPVASLLEQAVKERRLKDPGVQIKVSVSPEGLVADGDPERVHQVVANLLENAVRHSPPGGLVSLEAHPDADGVSIEVCDDGPGIPQEAVDRIFERFYRADSSKSRSDGATGLGLAIARWVVDLHGGAIQALHREPTGTRMVVSIPGGRGR